MLIRKYVAIYATSVANGNWALQYLAAAGKNFSCKQKMVVFKTAWTSQNLQVNSLILTPIFLIQWNAKIRTSSDFGRSTLVRL